MTGIRVFKGPAYDNYTQVTSLFARSVYQIYRSNYCSTVPWLIEQAVIQ